MESMYPCLLPYYPNREYPRPVRCYRCENCKKVLKLKYERDLDNPNIDSFHVVLILDPIKRSRFVNKYSLYLDVLETLRVFRKKLGKLYQKPWDIFGVPEIDLSKDGMYLHPTAHLLVARFGEKGGKQAIDRAWRMAGGSMAEFIPIKNPAHRKEVIGYIAQKRLNVRIGGRGKRNYVSTLMFTKAREHDFHPKRPAALGRVIEAFLVLLEDGPKPLSLTDIARVAGYKDPKGSLKKSGYIDELIKLGFISRIKKRPGDKPEYALLPDTSHSPPLKRLLIKMSFSLDDVYLFSDSRFPVKAPDALCDDSPLEGSPIGEK